MAAQADELHAMVAALAGSQALTLDALRRRGSIGQKDIDYILAVTEQGIAKVVGTAGPPGRGPNDQDAFAAAVGLAASPLVAVMTEGILTVFGVLAGGHCQVEAI